MLDRYRWDKAKRGRKINKECNNEWLCIGNIKIRSLRVSIGEGINTSRFIWEWVDWRLDRGVCIRGLCRWFKLWGW